MSFTAKDVATLRAKTGCGMMDCKKALTEANGDMEKASEILREKGLAASVKKASRIAAEGIAYAAVSECGKVGDVIEVREKSKQLPIVIAAVESSTREVPGYLEVDGKKLTAKYTFTPKLDDIPYGCVMEPNLVIEYYSR